MRGGGKLDAKMYRYERNRLEYGSLSTPCARGKEAPNHGSKNVG